jgi:hypothetical protein
MTTATRLLVVKVHGAQGVKGEIRCGHFLLHWNIYTLLKGETKGWTSEVQVLE